jgi:hypothetical protein
MEFYESLSMYLDENAFLKIARFCRHGAKNLPLDFEC